MVIASTVPFRKLISVVSLNPRLLLAPPWWDVFNTSILGECAAESGFQAHLESVSWVLVSVSIISFEMAQNELL